MRVVIRSIDKNNRKIISEIRMFSVYLLSSACEVAVAGLEELVNEFLYNSF